VGRFHTRLLQNIQAPPEHRGGTVTSLCLLSSWRSGRACENSQDALKRCAASVERHLLRKASKPAVVSAVTIMSATQTHALDTAKGSLGQKEREAVKREAHLILGPSEVVRYAFCTSGVSRDYVTKTSEPGRILFTTHRIIFYDVSRTRGLGSNTYFHYPFSALVSVSLPLAAAKLEICSALPYLKFRGVDCNLLQENATHVWIFVKITNFEEIRDLSAATDSMDRVPKSIEPRR
jgi:hypothetical protein